MRQVRQGQWRGGVGKCQRLDWTSKATQKLYFVDEFGRARRGEEWWDGVNLAMPRGGISEVKRRSAGFEETSSWLPI